MPSKSLSTGVDNTTHHRLKTNDVSKHLLCVLEDWNMALAAQRTRHCCQSQVKLGTRIGVSFSKQPGAPMWHRGTSNICPTRDGSTLTSWSVPFKSYYENPWRSEDDFPWFLPDCNCITNASAMPTCRSVRPPLEAKWQRTQLTAGPTLSKSWLFHQYGIICFLNSAIILLQRTPTIYFQPMNVKAQCGSSHEHLRQWQAEGWRDSLMEGMPIQSISNVHEISSRAHNQMTMTVLISLQRRRQMTAELFHDIFQTSKEGEASPGPATCFQENEIEWRQLEECHSEYNSCELCRTLNIPGSSWVHQWNGGVYGNLLWRYVRLHAATSGWNGWEFA